jgi:signal transduction histidine kinase
LDDITVVDGDGNRLVDTSDVNSEEDKLLQQALSGSETATLLIKKDANNVEISIAVVAPVTSNTGNILGAILLGRQINDSFLEELVFERDRVHLGLIYNNRILARTHISASDQDQQLSPTILTNDVALNETSVQLAQANLETLIVKNLVQGNNGVPHTIAYTPVLGSSSVAIMVLVDLEEISTFQNITLNNTIAIFVAMTLVANAVIYITIYYTTIRPLNKLRAIAQTMTGGKYDERAPVNKKDEVGQLAIAFNEMANAIQQREMSLQIAREQAERADRAKSMFLASVSHELRTPLNAIINLTKFVAMEFYGPVNQEQVEILGKTEASGKHLLNLINDVLDISKIEAGSLELFVETNVCVEKIVALAVETGRDSLINDAVTISYDVAPNLPLLTGDEQRIRQIVYNLISNACKFTSEGEILVHAYEQGDEVHIAICDSGPGIDPQDYDKIFDTFRQSKTGLRKGTGTGLGLPISRSLAEAHGGSLWFDSKPEKGATFFVALPIHSTLEPTI